jgi:2-phospho-L-lactate/phosphoenolpyruvate guanylyltransferase
MLAIVPVNVPGTGKRRLGAVLEPATRAAVVVAMLEDVVDACRQASAIDHVLVVTPDASLVPAGVDRLLDEGLGHAAAIDLALSRCDSAGALVVMADCPLAPPQTLDALCSNARPIALCPAQDGGVNAVALRPANAVEPAFGVREGAALTVERARAAGFEPAVIDDPLLALDVDLPDDLRRILELGTGTRTHALLDRILAASAECG